MTKNTLSDAAISSDDKIILTTTIYDDSIQDPTAVRNKSEMEKMFDKDHDNMGSAKITDQNFNQYLSWQNYAELWDTIPQISIYYNRLKKPESVNTSLVSQVLFHNYYGNHLKYEKYALETLDNLFNNKNLGETPYIDYTISAGFKSDAKKPNNGVIDGKSPFILVRSTTDISKELNAYLVLKNIPIKMDRALDLSRTVVFRYPELIFKNEELFDALEDEMIIDGDDGYSYYFSASDFGSNSTGFQEANYSDSISEANMINFHGRTPTVPARPNTKTKNS